MAIKKKETAMSKWDAELAEQAKADAERESAIGGGAFFTTRNGQLAFDGSPLPNSEIACIIPHYIWEYTFYEDDFDADNPSSPVCYAFGMSEDEMGPHKDCSKPQADDCASCDFNQWGSAEKGRGKACANRRRLAVIPAGVLDADGTFEPFERPEQYETPLAYLRLSPTSLKGFANYVKSLSSTLLRPLHGVYTRIRVAADAKTQIKVSFDCLGKIDSEFGEVVMKRRDEAIESIDFPYAKGEAVDAPKKPAKKPTRTKRSKY